MSLSILDELKKRSLLKNISSEEKFDALPKNCAVYTGFDPTAKSLHLGNFLLISALLRFKKFGYKAYAVLGGITGMIGDPSFRETERSFLDIKTIEENKKHIKKQLESFGLEVIDNLEFYKNWTLVDFLTKPGKMVNINYLLAKDSIATRLENGLTFTEFSYQLIQGWDFKTLYEDYNVKIQVGGSDQWGNVTTGLEMIRKIHGENADAVGLTLNLVTDENNNKIGKSSGGGNLWLSKEMTSPFSIYQQLLNTSDVKIEAQLKWLTFLELGEIDKIIKTHNLDKSKRVAQRAFAFEIVKTIHSEKIAKKCEEISQTLFNKGKFNLKAEDIDLLKGYLPVIKFQKNQTFIEIIKEKGILSSNREIREFLSKKSFMLDGEVVEDENLKVFAKHFGKKYLLLKKGKKDFYILEEQ
ncbi:tyrosyl-tRNA synthetase [Metamycoplasma subdolum]|uniref:Tyrosine--tRNA ligase n=1 Tax=Metamycoplasma subdolum TaxID=92407 RepID=A0A3L9ZXD5_9BACT|nr:tyrosine--tRNA ligase [Metamycoplasma subdolum]RMA77541.1 tyrosyl-tRNA synthetase [Metamycoplasma subdolum]WPB50733.1 tyrosine--tRNA ligase [Metamycoplasma subdolum]